MDVQGDAVDYMKSLVRDRLLLAKKHKKKTRKWT